MKVKSMGLDDEARSFKSEVNSLRKHVAQLEEKESKLSQTVKSKKRAEQEKVRTSFKQDMG